MIEKINFTKELSNRIAYMATQYDDISHSYDEAIENALLDENSPYDSDLISEYLDYSSENGADQYMDFDELTAYIESLPAMEAFRLGQFSDTVYSDLYDFYKLDGYENITGYSEMDIMREARSDSDFKAYMMDKIGEEIPAEWMDETRAEYIHLLEKGY